VLDRELTYQMPFERLVKLSRTASRRAFGSSWYLLALLFAIYLVALYLVIAYADPLNVWLAEYGLPEFTPMAAVIVGFFAAFWWLRRRGLNQARQRADYDSDVRFREDVDGLRFAPPEIEYLLRWHGISQLMLLETDGMLVSHGNLFFLVPNEAFRDAAERDALTRDVFARLNATAQERSFKFIPARLMQAGNTAGT
jgi:NADH:ubiquinone oxidoreductase subunit 3 (subunit A)